MAHDPLPLATTSLWSARRASISDSSAYASSHCLTVRSTPVTESREQAAARSMRITGMSLLVA